MKSAVDKIQVFHRDSREILKTLPNNSIDSCVCDPPYALVSIQKRFGKPGSAPAIDRDGLYKRASAGFMGQQWDTGEVAFDPAFWAEVLRVLKPGGHLLAFGGTRSYHRLACAIEDAGFEIRDQIGWLYGTGFPKSHDVSKGIDRHNGDRRPVTGKAKGAASTATESLGKFQPEYNTTSAASAAWEGWGTALKPAWEPICMARKPPVGTVAENVLQHGTGAINIDGCRIDSEKPTGWAGAGAGGDTWNESNMGLGKDGDPRPVQGRWPANIIHDGSDEVLAAFPSETSVTGRRSERSQNRDVLGTSWGNTNHKSQEHLDSGSAARFYYSAKADKTDRWGSKHPTVKPIDLMAYLVRLVTPPGGTVLDPFAGSGTTGVACLREGMGAILIERERGFHADILERLAYYAGEAQHSAQSRNRHKPAEKTGAEGLPLFVAPKAAE